MKNKSLLIIAFVGLPWITSLAQERKFNFGFHLFPNYSLGIISNDGSGSSAAQSSLQGIETWKPSISSHIFLEYTLNRKSTLGFGLGYQNNGERTKVQNLIFQVDPQTGLPIPVPSLPSQAKFVYNHHNLEIPVYYRLNIGKRFFGLVGLSGIVNIANTIRTVYYFDDGSTNRSNENDNSTTWRRFNFSINAGVGIDYFTNEKLSCFVLPYVQYGALGVSESVIFNRNFLSLGLSTGIRFL